MKVLLAQTDTTVGFLSQDPLRLREIKGRDETKPFLKVFCDFKTLTQHTRIPMKHKRLVRYARKMTFIVKNQAFRYVDDPSHAALVEGYGWLYSTSANPTGQSYEEDFCTRNADWIVEDDRGLSEQSPSKILKLGQHRFLKLR
jgi:tRNA A37 threonylcarbamoyladenosine synthetase subunit TsaC/SUA5/YrdC